MSWAARRRLAYILGVILFFVIVIGGPVAYHIYNIPATCHDGKQDGGETAIDEGGPCLLLNPTQLQPEGVLWARSFQVRSGDYDAVAYIDNPNQSAGVIQVPYELDLYDAQNALVEDITGTTFIMPGGVTPVFIGNISTGNRVAVHTQFQFTGPLVWERSIGFSQSISITNQKASETASSSQIVALVTNTSVAKIFGIEFVATVFDPNGNAIATSQTALQTLAAGASQQIFFTWPTPFSTQVGRVDIIPVVAPEPDPTAQQ